MSAIHRKILLLGAMALVGGIAAPVGFDAAEAQERRILECEAEGPGDISMHTEFEDRGTREKFSIEMEAAPGGAFREGQRVAFFVAGERVGTDQLRRVVGGDLVAELDFDTTAGPGDDDEPFPPNFPNVERGTSVRIKSGGETVLGCRLR